MRTRTTWEKPAFDEYLKANYKTKKLADIASELGVQRQTVCNHLKALGLEKSEKTRVRYWTEEEVKYIKANFEKVPLEDMAAKLGRSAGSVHSKLSVMGLKAPRVEFTWFAEDIEYLKANYMNMTVRQLAIKLARSEGQIKHVAKQLGLRKEDRPKKKKKWEPKRIVDKEVPMPTKQEFDLEIGDIVLAPFEYNTTNDRYKKNREFEVIGIYPNLINCRLVGSRREKGFPRQMYTCGQIRKVAK